MPARKPAEDLDEMLAGFANTLDSTAYRPNINRFKPLPKQELFMQSQAKGRILFGGNRAGKTEGSVADDVLVLLRRHPHRNHMYPPVGQPVSMRLIGTDFERGVVALLEKMSRLLPPSALKNGSWGDSYRESVHTLTLADKSTVSFMSYEQDPNKFQAVALHHVHFDEEPPKPIFTESMLRLVDYAGTWTLSETPVQQLEWVQDDLISPAEAGLRPDIEVFHLDTRENAHLPVEELMLLESILSPEEKIIRLSGEYTGGSLVFPKFKRDFPYIVPDEAFRLTRDWMVYESMDHGIVNPTAWLFTAVHRDGSVVVFDSMYRSGIVVSEWAKLVLLKRKEIADRYGLTLQQYEEMKALTVGDPSIGDSGNATAQTGITIQQAYSLGGVAIAVDHIRSMRAGNQNMGLDKITSYLRLRPLSHPSKPGQPWLQITAGNTALADELKKARKPKQSLIQKTLKNEAEQIRDKDNHAIDALKYFLVTAHDLRPHQYVEEEDEFTREQLALELGAREHIDGTHKATFAAAMLGKNTWTLSSAESYSALED